MSALIAAVVTATAYSIYSGERAAGQQKKAQQQALESAQRQESDAQQARNKAGQKSPDTASILAAAQQSAGGLGGTMLTGPAGINPGAMSLGKTTLLGG